MESKVKMVALTAYVASVKFEGRWYTSAECMNLEDALDFIKRARLKTHAQNMPCNIIEKTVYRAAQ